MRSQYPEMRSRRPYSLPRKLLVPPASLINGDIPGIFPALEWKFATFTSGAVTRPLPKSPMLYENQEVILHRPCLTKTPQSLEALNLQAAQRVP